MRFRRNEPFRYEFTTPIICSIQALQDKGNGEILDLSPNGMKITSSFEPTISTVQITFCLNQNIIKVTGNIRWKKALYESYIYGVQLENDSSTIKFITNELKLFVKRNRHASSSVI